MRRGAATVVLVVVGLLGVQLPVFAGDTVGLVDPATGQWHLRDGSTTQSFFYGNPGDVPFMGDWDCDGIATPGLFRQSDAFAYLRNSNTQGIADRRFFFGNPSDVPLAGDFNGDGCDSVSIYRPSEQRFYIINQLGENDGGLGAADFSFIFGNPGDQPFTGDFDGDGVTEVGLHRESTGFVYYRNTLTTGNADNSFFFGNPGDRFVAGDWSNAELNLAAVNPDTPAIFRPGDATFYFRDSNTQGNATAVLPFGEASFLPVAGDTGADPLVLNPPGRPPDPPIGPPDPPTRPPSPATPTSFDCFNPVELDARCAGNTDPADAADEAWECVFTGTTIWDCEGNIDKTDPAAETWGCTLAASLTTWNCDGDIDKRRSGSESWLCSMIFGVGWGCDGNIDGRSGANESWVCTVTADTPLSYTCAGDVDRSSPAQETWDCDYTTEVDWTCTGSHSWVAPMVTSDRGLFSFLAQFAVVPPGHEAEDGPSRRTAVSAGLAALEG